ncbi:hypothetical protein [Brevibacillus parabrevis]|nr:hypothetical protein [Brevibacillus parabrevis]
MFINKMMVPASLLLAFGLLLGACGSNPTESATGNKGGSATAASQPAATAENDTKPATRIVSTSMGDVEIPAHPERVVTDVGHYAEQRSQGGLIGARLGQTSRINQEAY